MREDNSLREDLVCVLFTDNYDPPGLLKANISKLPCKFAWRHEIKVLGWNPCSLVKNRWELEDLPHGKLLSAVKNLVQEKGLVWPLAFIKAHCNAIVRHQDSTGFLKLVLNLMNIESTCVAFCTEVMAQQFIHHASGVVVV